MSDEHPHTLGQRGARAARAAAAALGQPEWVVSCLAALAIGLTLAGVSRAYSPERIEQAARERGNEAVRTLREMQELMGRLAGADERTQHEQTNLFYNRKIRYTSDQRLYQQADYWASPVETFAQGRGDCEDYALLKQRFLEVLGLPRSALLLTVVLDDRQEGHAVLTIATSEGDFVLDNRRNGVRRWSDSDYTFLKRQSHAQPAPMGGPRRPAARRGGAGHQVHPAVIRMMHRG